MTLPADHDRIARRERNANKRSRLRKEKLDDGKLRCVICKKRLHEHSYDEVKICVDNLPMHQEDYAILSLAGRHAKESFEEIITRKQKDIENVGYTYWQEYSSKSYPDKVQSFKDMVSSKGILMNCLLYKGNTQDTQNDTQATEWSKDKEHWQKISPKLSPVTGKLTANSHALVFSKLESVDDMILNLENYLQFDTSEPIKNTNFFSTFCAQKIADNREAENEKNIRQVFAVGKLKKPGSVWLR